MKRTFKPVGESTIGTAGQSLMSNMAMDFKNNLSRLSIYGDTGLHVTGIAEEITNTPVFMGNGIFEAVCQAFGNLPPNTLGQVGVFLSPQSFNELKIEILKRNLPFFSIHQTTTSNSFMFPGLDIEVISHSGMQNSELILTPYKNIIRFAGRIDDDDFINTTFDHTGNVIFNVNTLFGITLKDGNLAVRLRFAE